MNLKDKIYIVLTVIAVIAVIAINNSTSDTGIISECNVNIAC